QRLRTNLETTLAERLEDVAVDRPADEGFPAQKLPVNPRPPPGQRVALIPAPLADPQAGALGELAGGGLARAPYCIPVAERSVAVRPAHALTLAARLRGALRAVAEPRLSAGVSVRAKKAPVWEAGSAATSSGVPAAITSPPSSPPSGPMSIRRSADLITSRLCSITTTLLRASTRRRSTSRSRATSAKCRPVVGSSRM